ncbi:MAG: (Dimethylallyl)adenosine tRNA methylthiotransferase MiaB [Lentisphaerae bacterium ADurb.Bin242]|nr:MAG: (Dimethylallyl)adenosine tRNA methylthiotransferase MiaB [Lentisphaerae bacterium ADurb.Bin242]
MNVYIKTYGCQMNERDSESAAAMLAVAGHTIVSGEQEADVVILNTCSVREQAERKAVGKLGILKKQLRERPWMIFGIMGCMAQSRGEELLRSVDHLDFVVGTDNIHTLPEILRDLAQERRKVCRDACMGADTPGIDAHRIHDAANPFSAFVSISRGCNRYCSYCIVPYVRGPERSRNADGILTETEALAKEGVTEVMLLGQNVAAYGLDGVPPPIPADNSPFADLLERVHAVEGIRRIRFTSPHPAFFNRKLIETVARLPKVCKNIHLPLQSGSDRILKKMNRPYTAAEYLAVVSGLRSLAPGITFSTDIIVGFPGETAEDFEATRSVMRAVRCDNAYIFKYSPRKGTVSSRMADDVPQEEKERRNQELLAELERINAENNAALVGRTFELLAEGPSKRNPSRWSGRTDTFKQVVFTPSESLKPGDYVPVKIMGSTSMTLYGERV